jgi:hypothetical protein
MSAQGDNGEAGAAVPAGQKQSWSQFIKSIASFSGDLSSLTAPPFILSPVSLTEFPAYWGEHPNLFADIAAGKNEEERMVRVLKWFISTLKGQYTTRNDTMGSEKKPLNPALGELFFGTWPDIDGRGLQTLAVEQVSHHPPITAYYMENASKGISLQGYSGQKTSFSAGAIIVRQVGHAMLTLKLAGGKTETYLITLPRLRIDGIWYGSPYIELTDSSWISSSTGWNATLEYKGRGYFSGRAHSIKMQTFLPNSRSAKQTVEGQWDTVTTDVKTGQTFTDVTGPKEIITVKPIDEQDNWESRKLWELVAQGIREGDYELASVEKTKIENEQRQRRRDEQAAGKPWELRYFVHVENDPEYEKLGKIINVVPPTEDYYVYQSTPNPTAYP